MKTLATLLIGASIWSSAIAQNKTTKDQAGLIGPVKTVEAYIVEFWLKDGKIEPGKRRPWYVTDYNSEGNVVEQTSYDHLGAISERCIYNYDSQGHSTGYEEYPAMLDKTLKTARKHVYTLDESGKRVAYRVYDSDGTTADLFTYKYDAKGNKIEDGYHYHTGFGGKTVYTFDEHGNPTSQASYAADGTLGWKTVSTFDDRGQQTEWLQYQGDKLRYKIISTYDEQGRILEKETMEFNGIPNVHSSHAPEPGKVVYTYADEKRTKEVATYGPDGALKERSVYTYDERGTEVERAMFKGDGSATDAVVHFYDNIFEPGSKFRGSLSGKSVFEIEYDSHGNWTKKTFLIQTEKGGKPQPYRTEQRVITYH